MVLDVYGINNFEQVQQQEDDEEKNHRLSFSLLPYLKPQEELLDIGTSAKSSKFFKKKLREQIMFSIEPIPLKMNFQFAFDENRDQAFIGDNYEVLIDILPDNDITITEMKLYVDNVDFEVLQQNEQSVLLEQSVNLNQSQIDDNSTVMNLSQVTMN